MYATREEGRVGGITEGPEAPTGGPVALGPSSSLTPATQRITRPTLSGGAGLASRPSGFRWGVEPPWVVRQPSASTPQSRSCEWRTNTNEQLRREPQRAIVRWWRPIAQLPERFTCSRVSSALASAAQARVGGRRTAPTIRPNRSRRHSPSTALCARTSSSARARRPQTRNRWCLPTRRPYASRRSLAAPVTRYRAAQSANQRTHSSCSAVSTASGL